jgi:hypothetical protein
MTSRQYNEMIRQSEVLEKDKKFKELQNVHGNVKCDCGHRRKDHYQNSGFCHHSKHPNQGKCGCTWFHPNVKYIKNK